MSEAVRYKGSISEGMRPVEAVLSDGWKWTPAVGAAGVTKSVGRGVSAVRWNPARLPGAKPTQPRYCNPINRANCDPPSASPLPERDDAPDPEREDARGQCTVHARSCAGLGHYCYWRGRYWGVLLGLIPPPPY